MTGPTGPSGSPAAPEAEAGFLGCILTLAVPPAREALADVTSADFTVPAHRMVFETMRALLARDEVPGPLAVLNQLRSAGLVSHWPSGRGVGVFLAELYEAAPVPLGYGAARRAILEAAARRRLHQGALRLLQVAGDGPYESLPRLAAAEMAAFGVLDARLGAMS